MDPIIDVEPFSSLNSPFSPHSDQLVEEHVDELVFNDLNLPTTIKKDTQTGIQYTISIFVFFNKLSPSHKGFQSHLSPLEIQKKKLFKRQLGMGIGEIP